ncbi:putative glucosidase 2 beta subunit-like protein [Skeletonema marinoi]|uniref:Glucosidase 2 beta subunit-like protein n=1 Tax=Skeletonema marinoi TaxID=267567 RepID=A0AAD9DGL4_9STRA|nr:putative glucosidase 2 beta subunit-like protein [Skeletonema marinoi]
MTMALLRPSLLSLLLLLISLIHNHNVALVSAEESSSPSPGTLRCLSGWTRSSKLYTISPDRINDGYCDCPLDGLDEIETGACSGSMDGMWTGIPSASSFRSIEGGGASAPSSNSVVFVVRNNLRYTSLPLVSTMEFATAAMVPMNNHQSSDESASSPCPDVCDTVLAAERIATQNSNGSGRDIVHLEHRLKDAKLVLSEKRIDLVKVWTLAVDEVLSHSTLKEIVTNEQRMSVQTLGLFIISMCQLSGEASADQVANGRCLPFDRASLDLGILWDNDGNGDLPSFHVFDAETEESIANYAEKLVLRLEGRDARSDSTTTREAKKSTNKNRVKRPHPEPDMDDFDDDYHDYHDDDYISDSGDYINEKGIEEGNDGNKEGDNATVKNLMEKLPLLAVRDAFKMHGKALLASSATDDNADIDTEEEEDSATEDETSNNNVDPMALSMARSTISKRLGNIDRGETSSKSAARDGTEQTCSDVTPWSDWCPPVTLVSQSGVKLYPPPFIVAAAERRCSQREDAVGVCSGKEEETDAEFPLSVPDGYYAYYEPQVRTPADEISPFFAAMDLLRMPGDLTNAKKTVEDIDTKLVSTRRELTKLENELDSSDTSKYGVDGELFMMRDSCHKIESGKYEYEVCIFGKATQRDIGQKVRSAEVIVTCGRATKILSADEPETCRYTRIKNMELSQSCHNYTSSSFGGDADKNVRMFTDKLVTASGKPVCRYALGGAARSTQSEYLPLKYRDMLQNADDDTGAPFYFYYNPHRYPQFLSGVSQTFEDSTTRRDIFFASGGTERSPAALDQRLDDALAFCGGEYLDGFVLEYVCQDELDSDTQLGKELQNAIDHVQSYVRENRVRYVMASTHSHRVGRALSGAASLDAIMLRYNMSHRKAAETISFPKALESNIPVLAFTTTRWNRFKE